MDTMRHVVVIEPDADLCATLELILEDAGYAVSSVADERHALDLLRRAPTPLLVLLSHGGPACAGDQVLAQAHLLPPHGYLLLSTSPRKAPWVWNSHTEHIVPVIPEPFDIQRLIEQVSEATERLAKAVPEDSAGEQVRIPMD